MIAEPFAVRFPRQEGFDAFDGFDFDLDRQVLRQEPSRRVGYVLGEGDDFRFSVKLGHDVYIHGNELAIDIFAFPDDPVQVREKALHFIAEVIEVG